MRLQSIAIHNFRVLRHAVLELPDQVVGIIGPNGAGKSSIVEAVAWALYGNKVARSGKEEIRSTYASGDDNCAVSLEFEIGREHYRVERSLVGRTERPEVVLFRGAQQESVGAAETEKYISHLLGLDWRGFRSSFLARQQELNALADLAAGERREYLAGMLGIDRLDRALRLVKDDRKSAGQTADFLQQQLNVVDRINQHLAQRREHVVHLENQYVTTEGAWQQTARDTAQKEAQFREHQDRQAACSQLQVRVDAARKTAAYLETQYDELAAKAAQLAQVKAELEKLEPRLAEFESLRAEFDELKRRREVSARHTSLAGQAASRRSELEKVEQALAVSSRDLEVLNGKQRELPAGLPELVSATSAKLEEARREWADQKAKLAADEKSAAQLKEQLESIRQVGPDAVCERCRRPFGDDLPSIKEHLTVEYVTLEQVCVQHRQALTRFQDEGAALKREVERLQQLDQQSRDNVLKLENLRQKAADLDDRRQKLAADVKQLEDQMATLGEVAWDADRFKVVGDQVAHLETLHTRASGLKGELKALPETLETIARVRDQRELAVSETRDLERELKVIGFDPAAFDKAAAELAEQHKKLDEAKQAYLETGKELEITRREITLREEELVRLAEIGKKLEESRTSQYYAEKLVSLFSDFRKFTISRIRPRLAELSSQLMSEMSGGRYSLVDLDEDYNLEVMDNGAYFGIERFSGGEKDLASLCLRLAISLALTESAGLDRSFIILDEVFGSQDANRRDLIFESLANLKARFPQILLITHLEELKHKVETLVEIAPQPAGWSEVRVNGQVV